MISGWWPEKWQRCCLGRIFYSERVRDDNISVTAKCFTEFCREFFFVACTVIQSSLITKRSKTVPSIYGQQQRGRPDRRRWTDTDIQWQWVTVVKFKSEPWTGDNLGSGCVEIKVRTGAGDASILKVKTIVLVLLFRLPGARMVGPELKW